VIFAVNKILAVSWKDREKGGMVKCGDAQNISKNFIVNQYIAKVGYKIVVFFLGCDMGMPLPLRSIN
jgi:hypothetical protein